MTHKEAYQRLIEAYGPIVTPIILSRLFPKFYGRNKGDVVQVRRLK